MKSLGKLKTRNVMLTLLSILFIGSSLFITGCDKTTDDLAETVSSTLVDSTKEASITDEDSEMLVQMREEEKLARDVYDVLYEMYGLKVFDNISSSEQKHMDAVLVLLDTFGIPDPALPEAGQFSNPDLQDLYSALVAKGSTSLVDALEVGATIEDLDIYDLVEFTAKTESSIIQETFEFLTCGSRNHMRAFVSQLALQGVEYTPVYISLEEFADIINSEHERCGLSFASSFSSSYDCDSSNYYADSVVYAPLTAEDSVMLVQMREEEKLARDVYDALYEKWGLKVFDNISNSEQTHMDAILKLLEAYNIPDPALAEPGQFSSSTLQDLYYALVEKGSASLVDALTVGATIEDLDIYDLEEFGSKTDNEAILATFEHLTCGSRNHMRAFVSQLLAQGASYTPAYISQAEFDEIISSTGEHCGR